VDDGRAPARIFSRSSLSIVALACAVVELSCGPSAGPPLSRLTPRRGVVAFDYIAIDGSHLSSESTRHRVTVIALVTTYDLSSQVVLRELVDLIHTTSPRFNAGVIVLEPPRNAPLAQAFAETLELPFPLALADVATREARGPFGAVNAVPTLVVLDPKGAETWRYTGAVPIGTIRDALQHASRDDRR
jgi:hypothetical protein